MSVPDWRTLDERQKWPTPVCGNSRIHPLPGDCRCWASVRVRQGMRVVSDSWTGLPVYSRCRYPRRQGSDYCGMHGRTWARHTVALVENRTVVAVGLAIETMCQVMDL